jgi:hypothetical protein
LIVLFFEALPSFISMGRTLSGTAGSHVYSEFIFAIHKTVKCREPILTRKAGGYNLKRGMTLKQREEMKAKMSNVFRENVKELSVELQKILLDDLVTAFENRIKVLIRAQEKRSY